MISITEIKKIFKGKISLNEKMAPFTTFRIGGMADYYAEPVDNEDILHIIKYFKGKDIPYFVLGNGSNVLISDEGIRGVIINLEANFGYIKHEEGRVIAGAGAKLARFVDFCIQNSYAGVEMLAGIPGTIGGALVMNAGAYRGEISTYLENILVIKNETLQKLSREECGFVYRNSGLKNIIILEGVFKLPHGEQEEISKIRRELILKRNASQPVEIPNAGCIFKNPAGNYAAKLIDESGLKGTSVGGAMVSPKHANFIVNYDNATAYDVIELIKIIKQKVREKTGINLEMEVKTIGFEERFIL